MILGQLTIPRIVFQGHGLNETLCQERVEYAWLMDLNVGCIEGAIATEQVVSEYISIHTMLTCNGISMCPWIISFVCYRVCSLFNLHMF